ncbi:MAG: TonB-dependent receptor [Arenicella sp.]|nr:TonB-dependent receptor [Arenicella sp.]
MSTNSKKFSRALNTATLSLLIALPGTNVFAQSETATLEEVIVTAERRENNLQSTPLSVSSFSLEQLAAQQVNNIGDLQSLVPNLSVHVGDANNAVVYIRGVGQIDSVAFFEPGVGIYLDDVYLGRAQGAFLDIVDVERVEVLRGPQGSLYGRNTVGGAIKYVSAGPTEELSGNVSLTAGNYGRFDAKATLSGSLIEDKLLGRVTVAKLGHDGYSKNLFNGQNDGDADTEFFRGVLEYRANEDLVFELAFDSTPNDPDFSRTPAKETNIDVLVVDPNTFALGFSSFPADTDPFVVNADFNNLEETETQGTDLRVTWDINEQLSFKSITSYRELDYATELDLDGTPINAFGIFYYNDQNQFSQEFQLTFDNDRWSGVAGLYYFDEDSDTFDGGVFNNFLIASAGESASTTKSYAMFSHLDYHVNDKLSINLGFRYTEERKTYQRLVEDFDLTVLAGLGFNPTTFAVDYANPRLLSPRSTDLFLGGVGVARPLAAPPEAKFDNFSPKAGVNYQLDDDTLLYGSVSTGFKSGGFNGRLSDGQLDPFQEENLISYELGYKTEWMENRVRFNAAVFMNDYDDLQVSSFETTPDGNAILPVFANAGKAEIKGFEIELTALVGNRLTLNANLGYLDAEYKEYFSGVNAVTNQVVDVSDSRELVNTPKWDGRIGGSYDIELGNGTLSFLADVSYRSKTYLEVNSSENLAQDSYSIVNAAVMFETFDEQWQFILGGKNLGDKEYRTHAFDLSAFPRVELGYYNPPKTYSITANYRF